MEYKDIGQRIRQRLVELGYGKSPDDLDIEKFSWDHRFGRTNIYNWLADKAVPFKDLTRLCDALQCSEVWLLEGRERNAPKARPAKGRQHGKARVLWPALLLGAAAALWPSPSVASLPRTLSVATPSVIVHLLGSWRRRFRNDFRMFFGGTAFAL